MSFFSAVIPPLSWVVRQLLGDKNFGELVAYRRYVGAPFDNVLRHNVPQYTDFPLRAARMWHNKESVGVANSEVEIGDMLFLFLGETFPELSLCSTKDVILDANGNTIGIKSIDPIFGIAVSVTVVGAK